MNVTPRLLFYIDSIGAAVTAALTYFLLPHIVGPDFSLSIVNALAAMALLMSFYSLSCGLFVQKHFYWLLAIAVVNLLYCFATISIGIYFFDSISFQGLLYFFVESIIVLGLVYVEVKTAFKLKNKN